MIGSASKSERFENLHKYVMILQDSLLINLLISCFGFFKCFSLSINLHDYLDFYIIVIEFYIYKQIILNNKHFSGSIYIFNTIRVSIAKNVEWEINKMNE